MGIPEDHRDGEQEQDEPACDLERDEGNAHGVEQELAGDAEEQEDEEREGDRQHGGAPALRQGEIRRRCEKERQVADRIQHGPEGEELVHDQVLVVQHAAVPLPMASRWTGELAPR
jgi:hypothetical protein